MGESPIIGSAGALQHASWSEAQASLAVYGLERRQDRLLDLRIEEDQTLELDVRDPIFSAHHVSLRPQTLYDLKRWIGVPDEAVRVAATINDDSSVSETLLPHLCAPYIAQPPILRDNPEIQGHLHRFLFGHSDSMDPHHLKLLETYVVESPIYISFFAFQDIYVSKRSRLVISAKTQVLFARYITIETSGLIDLKAPFARIDCAGMRRLPPFRLGSTTTVLTTSRGSEAVGTSD